MRFIINFFIFGFIFYLIYIFFPEAFQTLVSWASSVYDFFHGLFIKASEKYKESTGSSQPPADQHKAIFLALRAMLGL